ncbi:hypothetical protein A2U01_0013675 [Trifolium medium]|uniref:Uncharacterized protein n=1 Tax=Trifolium medium TaxID=97028 RepID=A0A392MZH0_9FABA|nr:hypothetical protein [Trifolium medium]
MTRPSSLSKMRPAPLPLLLEDPSVNTVQLVHGFMFPGVSSAKKSANTCAFSAFCGSKDVEFGQLHGPLSHPSCQTWPEQYMFQRAKAIFSIFWYLSSGPESTFDMKYTGLWFVPTSLTSTALTASVETAR